jgi:hypothetical protein
MDPRQSGHTHPFRKRQPASRAAPSISARRDGDSAPGAPRRQPRHATKPDRAGISERLPGDMVFNSQNNPHRSVNPQNNPTEAWRSPLPLNRRPGRPVPSYPSKGSPSAAKASTTADAWLPNFSPLEATATVAVVFEVQPCESEDAGLEGLVAGHSSAATRPCWVPVSALGGRLADSLVALPSVDLGFLICFFGIGLRRHAGGSSSRFFLASPSPVGSPPVGRPSLVPTGWGSGWTGL